MIKNKYIIFDGDCGFCNQSILIFAKMDINDQYLFISDLSQKGQILLEKFNLKNITTGSIILIRNDKYFLKSEAIFNFLIDIKKSKILIIAISLLPIYICNLIYDFISKNRKKIIKQQHCKIPNKKILHKIINK